MSREPKEEIKYKVIEALVKEKKERNESDMWLWKDGWGWYKGTTMLGYALFKEFEGKNIKIEITVIEEDQEEK